MDQDGNGTIDGNEGLAALPPRSIVTFSDGFRQTAVDLMQLVRVIEVGVDVDGNGLPDLDASRISYLGSSLGAGFGTVFLALNRTYGPECLRRPSTRCRPFVWRPRFAGPSWAPSSLPDNRHC
jgi:hypothetical protein